MSSLTVPVPDKPVGQASVELIFDNSDGTVGGPYAGFAEVSIKRVLNRDTISTYYLNNTRCRRKDIQSIFLGTGIGTAQLFNHRTGSDLQVDRGQTGGIAVSFSRKLREYRKFRERRKETENRIRHTQENISRLTDILEELEKQAEHLQRQAKAAERFKELKQEERRLKAELLALDWKELSDKRPEKNRGRPFPGNTRGRRTGRTARGGSGH